MVTRKRLYHRIRCQGCGRRVKDHPDAKLDHIMRYHRTMMLSKIIGLFNPAMFEIIGGWFGDRVRKVIQ